MSCDMQLVPSTVQLSAEGAEFFFYYSLLGNDITSAPFLNLLSPSFQPERASVRIRSTKQVLVSYLGQQPALQVTHMSACLSLSLRVYLSVSLSVFKAVCPPDCLSGTPVLWKPVSGECRGTSVGPVSLLRGAGQTDGHGGGGVRP